MHDCWFDLDAARWDHERRRFELPFGRGAERSWLGIVSSKRPSHHDCALVIDRVTDVVVEDAAQIGSYDVNSISYDAAKRAIVIEANVPLEIIVEVNDVDVGVLVAGEPHSREGGLSWYTEGVDVRAYLGRP